jgi:hypothetical protein
MKNAINNLVATVEYSTAEELVNLSAVVDQYADHREPAVQSFFEAVSGVLKAAILSKGTHIECTKCGAYAYQGDTVGDLCPDCYDRTMVENT